MAFHIASGNRMRRSGFTLIELLIVMAIVATLLALVAPRYFGHLEHSKEVVLRQNLVQVRDAIDKFYADRGKYPDSLDELITTKYLRSLPFDPIADSAGTWTLLPPTDGRPGGVADLKSGAPGQAADGSKFAEW